MTSNPRLTGAKATLAAIALLSGPNAHALVATCKWESGSGPLNYLADFGSVYVPRDAPTGTIIEQKRFNIPESARQEIRCYNDGSGLLEAFIDNVPPLLPDPPPRLDSGLNAARIIQTNVEGVGAQIHLGIPFDGGASNSFRPINGDQHVPYQGQQTGVTGAVPIRLDWLITTVTLVKTGPIDPMPQALAQDMLRGRVTDIPDALRMRLSGVIHQAQCTLKADAVSENPVQLGEHDLSYFQGKGTYTAARPFSITLNDCEDDPTNITARAYIRLDGQNGSTPIDPELGLFSLTGDGKAEGIGIQLLANDGVTPIALNRDVPVTALSLPTTRLDFQARYYQHEDRVTPGPARGELSFTISYR